MGRKGRTQKRCPGCGEEGSRDKDKVCRVCASKIALADNLMAKISENKIKKIYLLAWAPHAMEYVRHADDRETKLRSSFWELARAVSAFDSKIDVVGETIRWAMKNRDDKDRIFITSENGHPGWHDIPVFATPEVKEKFQALMDSVVKALNSAYAEGFDRGSDMLGRLMKGDVSNEEINQESQRNRS